ncbi:MAG: CvpA family protein [Firmicutes bacterium]|nr:CvpA family protein [[Eubacterium] siraeum]MCM1489023.1 CvpA family protein [Bacillota bacterium]
MGTQFYWFFDAAVIVILIVFLFNGIRKGFLSVILGLVAMIAAFAVALPVSEIAAKAVYDSVVEKAVNEEINNQLSSVLDTSMLSELKALNMGNAKLNGKRLAEIDISPDSAGKARLDMTKLDLSETGMDKLDLTAFGITSDMNLSSMNLGYIELTSDDLGKYGKERAVLGAILAENLSSGSAFSSISATINSMEEALPSFMSGVTESVTSGESSVKRQIILCILETDTENFTQAITDNLVKPFVLVPARALIFTVIFVIILIILTLLSKLLKGINKIPVIGGVNKLLGAAAGLVQGFIVVLLICIFTQFIISLTGDDLMVINTMTVDETSIFRKIYYFEFLDFMA